MSTIRAYLGAETRIGLVLGSENGSQTLRDYSPLMQEVPTVDTAMRRIDCARAQGGARLVRLGKC